MNPPICFLSLFLLAGAGNLALTQVVNQEMTADRPGFRNSTHLVGRGIEQFESGLRYFEEGLALDGGFRLGLTDWLELRLGVATLMLHPRRRPDEEQLVGISPISPGIKFPILGRNGGHTRVVAVLKTTTPSGHSSQSNGFEPGSELIWEHELTDNFSIAGTWNVTRLKEERFVWQQAASVALNRSWSHSWRSFIEGYVLSPEGAGSGNQWGLNSAVVRSLGGHLSLDMSVGRSVHGPHTWYAMVGFAVRSSIPHP